MSHFTKIKTKLTDINILERTVKRSLKWETKRNYTVRGYGDNEINADLVAVNPNGSYDIGFIKNQEKHNDGVSDVSYEIVTDFYGLMNYTQESLLRLIMQNYAMTVIEDEATENGLEIGVPTYEKDGSIRLVLTKC